MDFADFPFDHQVDKSSTLQFSVLGFLKTKTQLTARPFPFLSQSCDILEMPVNADSGQVLLNGYFSYNSSTQRDLQYQVHIDKSKVEMKKYLGFNFSASGFTVHLTRKTKSFLPPKHA